MLTRISLTSGRTLTLVSSAAVTMPYAYRKDDKMRIAQPKPFFFEAGKRAVLLLHGFTGTSADVRMLGTIS